MLHRGGEHQAQADADQRAEPGRTCAGVGAVQVELGEQRHADARRPPCPAATSGRGPTRGSSTVVAMVAETTMRRDHRQERQAGLDRASSRSVGCR